MHLVGGGGLEAYVRSRREKGIWRDEVLERNMSALPVGAGRTKEEGTATVPFLR